jgi:hypothetical protein
MKTSLSLALAASLVLGVIFEMSASAAEMAKAPTSVAAANDNNLDSPELRRNAMSLELLGRGFLYSFDYDYMVNNDLAVGAGVSHYSISSGDSNASALIIPIYANYYFTSGKGRFFATGGANLMFASGNIGDDSKVGGSGVAGVIGGGYEYRADNGFLFRAAPYVFVGKASGAWLGLSLGYTI